MAQLSVEDGSGEANLLKLDFEPEFKSLRSAGRTVALEWRNIKYTISPGTKAEKVVLKGLSGQVNPREVVALMGPSGAGKSTLLNVLAGRITGERRGRRLEGQLLANGEQVVPRLFRKRVAYVMQEDALFATATTREALEFSAKLRLPSSVSAADRAALVDDIIASLGLTNVQNTMVGSNLVRGLSGGEKKRVSIGVELVSSPSVLFLDEPTSGLDSYSAWKVVRILNALAGRTGNAPPGTGCTVICSIHQPSSEVMNEFSHLVLLGQGNVIFQGELRDVYSVFKSVGMPIPAATNVADHTMLCVQTNPLDKLPQDNLNTRAPRPVVLPSKDGAPDARASMKGSFADRVGSLMRMGNNKEAYEEESKPGWFTQIGALALREFRNIFRDKGALIGRFGGTAFLNVLFAVIFLNAADQNKSTYTAQTHFGALTQIFIGALFGAAQPALLTFPLEKVTFLRERGVNTYASSAYMLAKTVVELVLTILTALVTLLVSYWTIGFRGSFVLLWVWITLLMEAAVSTALVMGSFANSATTAVQLAPIVRFFVAAVDAAGGTDAHANPRSSCRKSSSWASSSRSTSSRRGSSGCSTSSRPSTASTSRSSPSSTPRCVCPRTALPGPTSSSSTTSRATSLACTLASSWLCSSASASSPWSCCTSRR